MSSLVHSSFIPRPNSEHPILDPNHLESQLLTSQLNIALTHLSSSTSPTLCVLQKAGGIPLSISEIGTCVDLAVQRARVLAEWLEGRIMEDWSTRKALVEVQ